MPLPLNSSGCKFFILAEGYGRGYQEDGYIDASEQAMMEFDENNQDVIEWLDANMPDRYCIDDEYDDFDIAEVKCLILLSFRQESDALAFKLAWGHEFNEYND